jgi:hypothetical protein
VRRRNHNCAITKVRNAKLSAHHSALAFAYDPNRFFRHVCAITNIHIAQTQFTRSSLAMPAGLSLKIGGLGKVR